MRQARSETSHSTHSRQHWDLCPSPPSHLGSGPASTSVDPPHQVQKELQGTQQADGH